jgi:outer membrane PBP1 activator LpoA protein
MMNFKRLSLTVALAGIVAGCSMPPMKGPQVVDRNASNTQVAATQTESPDALLAKASKAQPIEAAQYKLAAARRMIELGDEDRAKSLLADIDTSILPPALRFDILSLQTRQAIDDNDPDQALSYLAYMPALSTLPEEDVLLSEQLYAVDLLVFTALGYKGLQLRERAMRDIKARLIGKTGMGVFDRLKVFIDRH